MCLGVSALLDYETISAYELEITVSDSVHISVINIDISITDVDEGGPTFSPATYTRPDLAENSVIGTSVIQVTATDPDSDTSVYGKLSYSISAGNQDNKFVIEPDTGLIKVAGVLNAETQSSYTLTVQVADDSSQATADVSITVTNVNDNAPDCTSAHAFTVTFPEEGAAGDVLYTIMCTDVDGDTLTYTLFGDTLYFQLSGTELQVRTDIFNFCHIIPDNFYSPIPTNDSFRGYVGFTLSIYLFVCP